MAEKSPKDMTFSELCELLNYIPKNRLLTTDELSEIVGLQPATVRAFRFHGTGPKFLKPPGSGVVLYSETDVLRWIASGRKQNTSEGAAA
ncbi:MAG: hypothetical protein EHM67_10100 [Hyphomicrobiaceae bacterium]|nr:MAG: hypothetical protein EHM67_14910 [Hyphomicrobiaceae bacterium]RPI39538.1 MAG: hypothetical protein EHM67_10100 [Hyphomicrobiaceae bacterium]